MKKDQKQYEKRKDYYWIKRESCEVSQIQYNILGKGLFAATSSCP